MYFKKATPESVGIDSAKIIEMLNAFKKHNIPMHSMLIARGDKLIYEAYWNPLKADENHRMYSQTKSYVGMAIGQLIAEGKLRLQDKIIDFFPEYLPEEVHPYLAAQTIEHMLNMHTCFTDCPWFENHGGDRVKYYFSMKPVHYPGTVYYYDSTGSFILGALVQKLTGKTFLDYLKDKALRKIGFSETSKVLTCPGGFAWGDSALLCTPMDMLLFGRLLANKGEWNGEQLLNRKAVEETTAVPYTCGGAGGYIFSGCGYGRQVWRTYNDSFSFFGMHGQFMIHNPKSDITFVCTAGCQRGSSNLAREVIFTSLFDLIVDPAKDTALPESDQFAKLEAITKELKLTTICGAKTSPMADEINGKTFKAEANPMGIKEFTIKLDGEYGEFNFINAQGNKTIKFGFQDNVWQQFPEKGYSKEFGGMRTEDHTYRCAASGAWVQENKLKLLVQIVDEYIGIMDVIIGFNDGKAVMQMIGDAEDFLREYNGYLTAE
ncbi:MAG: beta-lactamase family protein [Clostridia bacterium]|nr:beta-lactamase family protein [Clostridia bacterium]